MVHPRPNPPPPESGSDDRLVAALNEYQLAVESGSPPNCAAFVARYPYIGDRLAHCLDAIAFVSAVIPTPNGPKPRPPVRSLDAGVTLGEFSIVREVGRGGMGVVYEAIQRPLGRRVALKVLPVSAATNPQALQRFRHEAQAAATLQHPHIVPVYAVGFDDDRHYFAMQFIDGQALTLSPPRCLTTNTQPANHSDGTYTYDGVPGTVTTTAATLPIRDGRSTTPSSITRLRDVVRLVRDTADALQHAHEFGIVHRDIKPSNLLIDGKGKVWVADFGLAKLPGSDLTGPADLMGTVRYMSPEQANGWSDRVDARSDVYSLGVTLYELLTGVPAFQADDRRVLIRQVIEENPVPPRKRVRGIPHDLETICLKAMAKEQSERYSTAAAFRDDLQRFLEDRPILARRATWRESTWRWCRHYPAVAALLATSFVATVGFAVLSARLIRVNRDLSIANGQEANARKQLFHALDTAISGGAEDHLVGQRDLTPRQHEFYETVVRQFQALADASPDDDETQIQVAYALTALGGLKNRLDDPTAGEAILQDAIRRQQAIFARRPSDPELASALARSHWTLGHALEQKEEWESAAAAFETAIAHLESVARSQPGRVRDFRTLAASKISLGVTRQATGDVAAGLPWFQSGLTDLEAVLERESNDPWAGQTAADCLHLIGRVKADRGQHSEAKKDYDRGLTLIAPLVRHRKSEVSVRVIEAKLLVSRAGSLVALNDRPAARREYDAGVSKLSLILERSTGLHTARRQLGLALLKYGQLLAEDGDPTAALARFDDSHAAFRRLSDDQPKVPNYQHNLAWVCEEKARILLTLGRYADVRANLNECLRVWEPLAVQYAGKNPWYPLGVADATVTLLLLPPEFSPYRSAPQWEAAAVNVVANMQSAVASGWRPSQRTRTEYEMGVKWASFRERADFRAYLATLDKLTPR